MKRLLFLMVLFPVCLLTSDKESSCSNLFTQWRSLRGISSFSVFSEINDLEASLSKNIERSELQNLRKTGKVIWAKAIREEGIDASVFGYPSLSFTVCKLPDYAGKKVLMYRLSLELVRYASLRDDNDAMGIFWQKVYFIPQNEGMKGIEKAMALLFSNFLDEYQKANPSHTVPNFYLIEEDVPSLKQTDQSLYK